MEDETPSEENSEISEGTEEDLPTLPPEEA